MKKLYISTVKEKSDEFLFINQNMYSQLVGKMNGNKESLNDNLMEVVLKSALAVREKLLKENSRKLSTPTKDVTKKCSRMVTKIQCRSGRTA